MGSSHTRLGIGISINGIAVVFLAYALLSDGGDLYVGLNRTYLALSMVAPMIIALLLVTPSLYRSLTANYVLLGVFAALLLATFALARTPTLFADQLPQQHEGTAPAKGMIARY